MLSQRLIMICGALMFGAACRNDYSSPSSPSPSDTLNVSPSGMARSFRLE
jgi:hypothetical protein